MAQAGDMLADAHKGEGMATKAEPHHWTDEELLALPKDGCKYEVVDGELVKMSPAGLRHERVIMRLAGHLVPYVIAHKLGDVVGSNAMYVLPSANKRSPDISFIPAGTLDRNAVFPDGAPALAVEVLSPGDSRSYMAKKVVDYFRGGVRLLWIIDPRKRTATAYRSPTDRREIGVDGELDGEDVVPGFRVKLAELFA